MSTYEKDNKKLIYLPIDIKIDLPNAEDLVDWHNANLESSHERQSRFCMLGCSFDLKAKLGDWRTFPKFMFRHDADLLEKEVDDYKFHWAPGFAERFPTLVDAVNCQPFKQVTLVMWDCFPVYRPAHHDNWTQRSKYQTMDNPPVEPRRYNIHITDVSKNKFFMGSDENKIYPGPLDPNYPCTIFNDSDIMHGADAPDDERIIMSTFGVIDKDKHLELIERSLAKFPDRALWI